MKAMVNPHAKAESFLNPSSLIINWRRLSLYFLVISLNSILDLRLSCLRRTLRNLVLSLEMFSHNHDSENCSERSYCNFVNVTVITWQDFLYGNLFFLYLVDNGSPDTDLCCKTKAFL